MYVLFSNLKPMFISIWKYEERKPKVMVLVYEYNSAIPMARSCTFDKVAQ